MPDYYQILGVAENATDSEIKAAFKKKAVEFHPDKHQGDASMESIFKELNSAYQVLSNPYKRTRYDMNLKYGQFEVPPDPPIPEQPVRRRPPFHASMVKKQPFNSKENIKATFYAFMFAFTVALLIKGGIWLHGYLEAEELAKILAERRRVFDTAKVEFKEGRIAQGLLILDDMGSFRRTELDIRDYKDQMIQQILQKAHKYFENEKYAEAILNYELLERYPVSSSINLLLNKAEAYKKTGNFASAIDMYNEMFQMGYRSASFYYNFAKLYEEGPKNYATALRYYKISAQQAVSGYESGIGMAYPIVINANMIPSFHYDIYLKLANAYYLNQEYAQTIKSLEWTKEIWPDSAYQYVLSGRSNLALGDTTSACSDLEIAASLDAKFVTLSICN